MRLLLSSCVAGLMLLAIYVVAGPGVASAHSPDIRPAETNLDNFEEDEGYYNGPVTKGTEGPSVSQLAYKGGDGPTSYTPVPGMNPAEVALLNDLRQSPGGYLDDLRTARLQDEEEGAEEVQIPSSVLDLPWVADGQTDDEKLALDFLKELAGLNQEAAQRVAVMPFLQTFGPADIECLWSLTYLAEYDEEENEARDPDDEEITALMDVLNNPHLADGGGIDDEEAKVVTVVGGTNYFNEDLALELLNPANITVTERVLQGRGREIHMAIIRTDEGHSSTFDVLEYAVGRAETTMEKPLRTDYVALLVADDVLPSFAAGANFGTHMLIPPRFDVEDRSEYPGEWIGILLAHEVAHYYWFSDFPLWVDEGAADFMAGVSEFHRTGRRMDPDNVPCSFYQNILHLELSKPELGSYGGLCHYTLGERLFLDMHRTIGDAGFFLSFRSLHDRITEDENAAFPAIQHLSNAFLPSGLSGTQETIRKLMLAKHYAPNFETVADPVNPVIPAINGGVARTVLLRVIPTEDGIDIAEQLSGFPRISASRVVGRYLFTLVIQMAEPLPEDVDLEFEFVEYFQDGWVFDRTTTEVTLEEGENFGLVPVGGIGFIPNFKWPTGLYWFHVYHDNQKLTEMYVEVTP